MKLLTLLLFLYSTFNLFNHTNIANNLHLGERNLDTLTTSDISDSLQEITIADLDGKVIDDYLSVFKRLKHNRYYNKFEASYKIYFGKDKQSPDKTGNALFVYRVPSVSQLCYSLIPEADSIATYWTAWNIQLGGATLYYIDESHKQFRAEHSNLKYMLHKEKDGDILYFTIYDRSRENDKTTIKYDSAKKKVISFTREMENSAFYWLPFKIVKTEISITQIGKHLAPNVIRTTYVSKTGSHVIIENTDINYLQVSNQEYKTLTKLGVWKK